MPDIAAQIAAFRRIVPANSDAKALVAALHSLEMLAAWAADPAVRRDFLDGGLANDPLELALYRAARGDDV